MPMPVADWREHFYVKTLRIFYGSRGMPADYNHNNPHVDMLFGMM